MGPLSGGATALAGRDLRLRLRGWQWAGTVTLYISLPVLVVLAFLLHRYSISADAPRQTGIQLFQALAIFQVLIIAFITPAALATAVSGERQGHTWEFLLLSRLSPFDIVWGKLLAGLAFNLVLLTSTLPLFALVFLFGGVSIVDLIRVYLVFITTVIFLSVTSLLVSLLTRRLVVSYLLSWLVSLGLVLGLSLLAVYLEAPGQISLITMLSIPTQAFTTPAPLTPLAQLDPLAALLSTVPDNAGGNLLGALGTVHHAFGLRWSAPLWGVYALWALLLSVILGILAAATVRRSPSLPWQARA